jgi:hypothetical protein
MGVIKLVDPNRLFKIRRIQTMVCSTEKQKQILVNSQFGVTVKESVWRRPEVMNASSAGSEFARSARPKELIAVAARCDTINLPQHIVDRGARGNPRNAGLATYVTPALRSSRAGACMTMEV